MRQRLCDDRLGLRIPATELRLPPRVRGGRRLVSLTSDAYGLKQCREQEPRPVMLGEQLSRLSGVRHRFVHIAPVSCDPAEFEPCQVLVPLPDLTQCLDGSELGRCGGCLAHPRKRVAVHEMGCRQLPGRARRIRTGGWLRSAYLFQVLRLIRGKRAVHEAPHLVEILVADFPGRTKRGAMKHDDPLLLVIPDEHTGGLE